MKSTRQRAFTLIELLIVVAIIAILAAIAVPNFLEAQTRAKTAAVLSDMRTVATALESYQIDNGEYPPITGDTDNVMNMGGMMRMPFLPLSLTTPISYIKGVPLDPFNPVNMTHHDHTFLYLSNQNISDEMMRTYRAAVESKPEEAVYAPTYALYSTGPDRTYGAMTMQMDPGPPPTYMLMMVPTDTVVQYDPTNGTLSAGDIVRFKD